MHKCYLCGNPATKPLQLKDTFTSHNVCRVPTSNKMCDRCAWCIPLRCFYYNEAKGKWSKLFSRNWSWFILGDKLVSPIIEGEHTEGKDTLPVVKNLATRIEIKEWLLNPPTPPFTIAIAESGQKHILHWAKVAQSQEVFPVQFELDTVFVTTDEFQPILAAYESLMKMDFSKIEIESGEYSSARLMKVLGNEEFEVYERAIASYRGTRLLQLVGYVATKQNLVVY